MLNSAANLLALSVAGLALAPFFALAGEAHHPIKPLHAHRAVVRAPVNSTNPANLAKRAQHNGVRATWYDVEVGLGACGDQSHNNEFTIALNFEEWGGGFPGPQCNKRVGISYQGKYVEATIKDQCPVGFCVWGQIDLSPATFEALAPRSAGVIMVDWDFLDGSASRPDAAPAPTSTTTQKHEEPTTSSTIEKTTTTTSSEPPTTTSSSSSTTSTSSSASAQSSSSTTASGTSSSISGSLAESTQSGASIAAPSPSKGVSTPQTPVRGENISNIFEFTVQLGNIVGNAAQVKPGPVRRDL